MEVEKVVAVRKNGSSTFGNGDRLSILKNDGRQTKKRSVKGQGERLKKYLAAK